MRKQDAPSRWSSMRSQSRHRPRRFARPWQLVVAELSQTSSLNACHPTIIAGEQVGCSCPLCRGGALAQA